MLFNVHWPCIIKFFHSFATDRRNSKSIWALNSRSGETIEDDSKLHTLGVQHFPELFSDDGKTNIEAQLNVIRLYPSFVQEEDKELFLTALTLQDVEGVLIGFKKDKGPGPDGWPVEFYLHFFDLVGKDILNVIEHSRLEGRVIGVLNATFITLIPKCDKATTLGDFRPISLCNLIYKTI